MDVKYFTPKRFCQKEYLKQASRVVFQLLRKLKLKEEELIHVCKGYVFDEAAKDLKRNYGDNRVRRIKVTGEPQRLTETAYLDEIRNLGYKPLKRRAEKRAKSFFHMMNWLKKNPDKLRYAKTGWPRLSRYRLFRPYNRVQLRKKKSRYMYNLNRAQNLMRSIRWVPVYEMVFVNVFLLNSIILVFVPV